MASELCRWALLSDPLSQLDTPIGSSSMRLDVDEWNETQTALLRNGTVYIQG